MIKSIDKLCDLALRFALVNRTGVFLPDGTPESDTDHTVMLGWVACALANEWYPELDLGLIAQFALVHDAPEIYAGDVYSLGMSNEMKSKKQEREAQATAHLAEETQELPWFGATLEEYEKQISPESRFVRAVDKILPKITVCLNGLEFFADVNPAFIEESFLDQYDDIVQYAGEFKKLIQLYSYMCRRVMDGVRYGQATH